MVTNTDKVFGISIPRILFFFLIVFLCLSAIAQQSNGRIVFSDVDHSQKCKSRLLQTDSVYLYKFFNNCIAQSHRKGYLAARIDSIDFFSDPITAFGVRGSLFRWTKLEVDSISLKWFKKNRLNIYDLLGKPVKPHRIVNIIEESLKTLENNGYPFAKISLSSTSVIGGSISTQIILDKGQLIVFDTLYIKGNVKISQRFIESYIGFESGRFYSEKIVDQFDRKLRKLPYVSLLKPSEIDFTPGKARVYTYMKGKRSNRFAGIVGFATGDDSRSKIRLTGSLNLDLSNSLSSGESISLRWHAPGEGSQNLKISTSWPFVFGTNMALDGKFVLYKRDSSYLNLNPYIALGFFSERGDKISIGFNHKNSKTISSSSPSSVKDFSTSLADLSYQFSNFPYNSFTIRGFSINGNIGAGQRRVKNFDGLENTESSSLVEIGLNSSIFTPLYKEIIILRTGLKAEKMASLKLNNNIEFLENELLRIGGGETLRGFNEESIIADGYALLEAELHFRATETASLFVFYEKACVSSYSASEFSVFWPVGTGIGLILGGESGILNISYALGKGFGQDFQFKDAKLHVGFTASF